MKILIIVLFCSIAIYIGYYFSKKYKQRLQFFQSIVLLCQKFDVEINFSRERMKNIFLNLDEKHQKKLFGVDKNFLAFLDQESALDKITLFKNITFLKEEEKDILLMFFKSLGRSDLDSQSKEIKNFTSRFDNLTKSAEQDNKKYGALSIKLGIVASLFIIILFI